MNQMTQTAPVRHSLYVANTPQACFSVFTSGMGRWWPRSHSIGTSPLVDVVIEPRAGGSWHEVGQDGSTCLWGRVLAWEPPAYLLLDWQITADWAYDPALHTEVELRFGAEGAGTRVDLVHRGLDAYAPRAAEMAGVFASPGGWPGILQQFAASPVA